MIFLANPINLQTGFELWWPRTIANQKALTEMVRGFVPFLEKKFTFTGLPMIYKSKKVGKKSESEEKVKKKTVKMLLKKLQKKPSHESHHQETNFLKITYEWFVCIYMIIYRYLF